MELVEGRPVFLPARPIQYLRRLRLQNEEFGDEIGFVGVYARGHDLRVVIEQPHVAGRAPDWAEMDRLLRAQQGLRRIDVPPMGHYRSFSYLRDQLGVFDVHPANCVVAENGALLPIDFVLVEFNEEERRALETRTV